MSFRLLCLWIVLWSLGAAQAESAEPEIRTVDLRGLTLGQLTTVTIDGVHLSPESRLVLPFPATQEIKPGATATRAAFDVTVPGDVVPGVYNLRIASADGVSSPVVIGVDALLQLPTGAEIVALPVAVHGTVGGSSVVEVRFPGKAGDEVTIEVEAARLGSKLRPVLHLLDPQRQQLGWSWSSPRLRGDARLISKLPSDGVYTVALHDLEYASPAPSHFRLKLGRLDSVDQVFPPVVVARQDASLELLGSGGAVAVQLPAANPDQSAIPVPWLVAATASGLRPAVGVSWIRELLEQTRIETPQDLTPQDLGPAPVGVSGRLSAPGELDRYQLSVTPGQKLKLEVAAERLGSPLDGIVVLTNDQGGQLARGDDSLGSSDPVLDFTVPANVTSLRVEISDALMRGGPESIYRLEVRDISPGVSAERFQLLAQNDRVSLFPGVRNVLPVIAARDGYDGAIQLVIDGLPAGVVVDGAEIPAGAEGTLLTLSVPAPEATVPPVAASAEATDGKAAAGKAAAGSETPATALALAAPAAQVALLTVRGRAVTGEMVQTAVFEAHPLAQWQPWLSSELAVAVSLPQNADSTSKRFQIDWNHLPGETELVLAGKLTLPVQLVRPAGEATSVRLTVVTSQNIPQANGRPDMNKALRAAAAVEIAADKLDGQVVLLIPPDLPRDIYDVTLKAELLTANKQQVVATAFAPVRRLNVLNPISLKLAGDASLETSIDPKAGATVVIAGQVARRGGMAGPVTITLTGLPGGVTAPNVVVKPEDSAFEVTVKFPASFQAAELSGLELTGSGPPDPAQAGVVVKSKPVTLAIKVTPTAASPEN